MPVACLDDTRYIGVVCDGATDARIMERLMRCFFANIGPSQIIRLLRNDYRQPVGNFLRLAKAAVGDKSLEQLEKDLAKEIKAMLVSTMGEFRNQIEMIANRGLTDYDIVLIAQDAECVFESTISKHLNHGFARAAEEFYSQMVQWSYRIEDVPFIMPLILFPSTDYLVAAARCGVNRERFDVLNLSPADVKMKLYGVDTMVELAEDDIEQKALQFITAEGCRSIYLHVPETRMAFRILSSHHGVLRQLT